jgi:voltage-gated potassium channel
MARKISRSTQRLLLFVAALPATLVIMALIYMTGMEHFEGSPRTFLESLQWASETLTTTGYGNDSHWQHPVFALFVILGQIMGQFLVFLIFPIFLLPYLEERFQTRLPRQLPAMAGKVLFYRHGPAIESLLVEFSAPERPSSSTKKTCNWRKPCGIANLAWFLANWAKIPRCWPTSRMPGRS